MAYQDLQLLLFGGGRCPRFRLLGAAEIGDEGCVAGVSLVAAQAAVGITFDTGGVDHTHRVASLMQESRHRITIIASGFQTDMQGLGMALLQKVMQAVKAFGGVVKLTRFRGLTVSQQHHIQFGFTHIDPQVSSHGFTPLSRSPVGQPRFEGQPCAYKLVAFDTVRPLARWRRAAGLIYKPASLGLGEEQPRASRTDWIAFPSAYPLFMIQGEGLRPSPTAKSTLRI